MREFIWAPDPSLPSMTGTASNFMSGPPPVTTYVSPAQRNITLIPPNHAQIILQPATTRFTEKILSLRLESQFLLSYLTKAIKSSTMRLQQGCVSLATFAAKLTRREHWWRKKRFEEKEETWKKETPLPRPSCLLHEYSFQNEILWLLPSASRIRSEREDKSVV